MQNTNSDNFIRKSYKFLIKSNNLTKVKNLLEDSFFCFKFDDTTPNTQKILSTYFDNDSIIHTIIVIKKNQIVYAFDFVLIMIFQIFFLRNVNHAKEIVIKYQ